VLGNLLAKKIFVIGLFLGVIKEISGDLVSWLLNQLLPRSSPGPPLQ
jgi:hypothetical protein